MTEEGQNPGHKWRNLERDGDGDKYFDNYRYTPYTTDNEFFRDPKIYETEVARTTQDSTPGTERNDDVRPRGENISDERIKDEIRDLLLQHSQIDARDIRVDVRDGIVSLSGTVSSQEEKQTAEKIVGNVFGVVEVSNTLDINKRP